MALPIIVIYQGKARFLWYVLRQAKFFNPESEVILLGDGTNLDIDFVKHYSIKDYSKTATEFAKHYKHLSTNPYHFELICIQRWFIILELMKKHEIEKCIHIDADLLVYYDVSEKQKDFASFDFTLTESWGPQSLYINRVEGLAKFCQYIMEAYVEPENMSKLENWINDYWKQYKYGGICDMYFFNSYQQIHPNLVVNLQAPDGHFDNNFNHSEGFVAKHGRKKIIFRNGMPYGLDEKDHREVRFFTLHMQGGAKRFIPFYSSQKDWAWFKRLIPFLLSCYYQLARKAFNKLKKNFANKNSGN